MLAGLLRDKPAGSRNLRGSSTRLRARAVAGVVAVLLFWITRHGTAGASDASQAGPSIFQFTCEFRCSVGRGHLEGLLASDGSQHRIAIYWIEPDVFRESASFVRYSDFIFHSEGIHYWVYPDQQRATFRSSSDSNDPLLPLEDSVESIVRCVLALVTRARLQDTATDISLAVGKSFQNGPNLTECATVPGEADTNGTSSVVDSVAWMQALSRDREHSKERRSDGALTWQARGAASGPPVARVIVKPVTDVLLDDYPASFNEDTLGQWPFIPEPYRVYWSFDRAYSELSTSSERGVTGRELYDEIQTYLGKNDLPDRVRFGLHRLWLKIALITDDMNRVRQSVRAAVVGLRNSPSVSKYRALLELTRIIGQIEKRYPQQPLEWLRPSVEQIVRHADGDIGTYLDRLMPMIDANNWFLCGQLLLDEVGRQGTMEQQALKRATARFEAIRTSRETRPPDPCEASESVKEYLARLDNDPPRGMIDMNDLHRVLETGLGGYCAHDSRGNTAPLVERILRSLRLTVGDGPFSGDHNQLAMSIQQFTERHQLVCGTIEDIDTVLATFLALSFYDISTREDHEVLLSQFRRCSTELQSQVTTMLNERGLRSLVTSADVALAIQEYERDFRTYMDDPLWPPFKFPLTANEEARLSSKLTLHAMQLEPLFDEMFLKLKYGGDNAQLKDTAIRGIQAVAAQLIPETAFLRRPMYPGVSCHFRGGHGLTALIEGSFYQEGRRPRELFRAMRYFHLGHWLEEVVERERELARAVREYELRQ